MARLLIAVVTCKSPGYRAKATAQRSTWVRDCAHDVRFFLGGSEAEAEYPDEVMLSVHDGYHGLTEKVRATMTWARRAGYDHVLKVDDDTFLVPDRLDKAGIYGRGYVGNFRASNGGYPHEYASGFAYLLDEQCMNMVADAKLTDDTMEDRWVGNVLGSVDKVDEKRFACTSGIAEPKFLWGSTVGKVNIAFAEYGAERFAAMHYWYRRVYVDSVSA